MVLYSNSELKAVLSVLANTACSLTVRGVSFSLFLPSALAPLSKNKLKPNHTRAVYANSVTLL